MRYTATMFWIEVFRWSIRCPRHEFFKLTNFYSFVIYYYILSLSEMATRNMFWCRQLHATTTVTETKNRLWLKWPWIKKKCSNYWSKRLAFWTLPIRDRSIISNSILFTETIWKARAMLLTFHPSLRTCSISILF